MRITGDRGIGFWILGYLGLGFECFHSLGNFRFQSVGFGAAGVPQFWAEGFSTEGSAGMVEIMGLGLMLCQSPTGNGYHTGQL